MRRNEKYNVYTINKNNYDVQLYNLRTLVLIPRA